MILFSHYTLKKSLPPEQMTPAHKKILGKVQWKRGQKIKIQSQHIPKYLDPGIGGIISTA